jgi:ribose transport system permease protein
MNKDNKNEHESIDRSFSLNQLFLFKLKRYSKSETFGVLLVFVGLCIILAVLRRDSFLTVENISSVGRAFSYTAIMAIGMTYVIITNGIDLSVGAVFGFSGMISALAATRWGLNIPISIIFGLAAGAFVGFMNGILITRVNLPAFIATLGTMSVVRGLAFGITSGTPVILPNSFNFIGQGEIFSIPYMILYMIILGVIFAFILNITIFGRRVYAVGGSEEASKLSGINVNKVKIWVYSISGILSAIAGIVTTSRMGVAQSGSGQGYELDVIAAVVIGGTSMSGGKGKILGSLLGAAVIGVLRNALVLLDVSSYWQQTVIGLVIIGAVTIDQLRFRKKGVR